MSVRPGKRPGTAAPALLVFMLLVLGFASARMPVRRYAPPAAIRQLAPRPGRRARSAHAAAARPGRSFNAAYAVCAWAVHPAPRACAWVMSRAACGCCFPVHAAVAPPAAVRHRPAVACPVFCASSGRVRVWASGGLGITGQQRAGRWPWRPRWASRSRLACRHARPACACVHTAPCRTRGGMFCASLVASRI